MMESRRAAPPLSRREWVPMGPRRRSAGAPLRDVDRLAPLHERRRLGTARLHAADLRHRPLEDLPPESRRSATVAGVVVSLAGTALIAAGILPSARAPRRRSPRARGGRLRRRVFPDRAHRSAARVPVGGVPRRRLRRGRVRPSRGAAAAGTSTARQGRLVLYLLMAVGRASPPRAPQLVGAARPRVRRERRPPRGAPPRDALRLDDFRRTPGRGARGWRSAGRHRAALVLRATLRTDPPDPKNGPAGPAPLL